MWGQLAGVGRHQDNDEGGEPQQSGNLWSRFVQVATDVAQDLAQPQDNYDDDDDEYYDDDDEGVYEDENNAWAEEDETFGVEGTPTSTREEGQGEEQYAYEDEYQHEENEVQYADGEEEHQNLEEGDGWRDEEEEVDFGAEDLDPNEFQNEEQPEQGLFDHTAEGGAASTDEWDLDGDDLFDGPECQQSSPQQQEETMHNNQEEDAQLGDEEFNAGWNDDGLNFDDSHLEEEVGAIKELPEQATEQSLPQMHNEYQQNSPQQQEETMHFSQEEEAQLADEENRAGWNDDSLNFDDSHIEEEGAADSELPEQATEQGLQQMHDEYQQNSPQQQKETMHTNQEEDAQLEDEEMNTGWNDDGLNFDDSHLEEEVGAIKELPEQAAEQGLQQMHDEHQQNSPQQQEETMQHNQEEVAQLADEENRAGWNDDSLNFFDDSHIEEEGAADSELPEQTTGQSLQQMQNEYQQSVDGNSGDNRGENEWGDDDNFQFDDSHVEEGCQENAAKCVTAQESAFDTKQIESDEEEKVVAEQVVSPELPTESAGENEWNDDDGLNFDDSHVEEEATVEIGSNEAQGQPSQVSDSASQQRKEAEPVDPGANEEGAVNNASDQSSLEVEATKLHDAGDIVGQASEETFGTAEEQERAADAWDDGLDFGEQGNVNSIQTPALVGQGSHETFETANQEQQQAQGEAGPPMNDDFASSGTGIHDDGINKTTDQGKNPTMESVGTGKNEGGEWEDDDLNFSEHLGEAVHAQTETEREEHSTDSSKVVDEGDAWENDDLNLSSHHETAELEGHEDDVPDSTADETNENCAEPAQTETSFGEKSHEIGENAWDNSELNLDDDLPEKSVQVTQSQENAWDDSDLLLDGDELETNGKDNKVHGGGGDDDDDSTVEQSNIGVEQPADGCKGEGQSIGIDVSGTEVQFEFPGLSPSRRATVRAANTTSASTKDPEDESDATSEKILGTSVMFADLTVQDKSSDQKAADTKDDFEDFDEERAAVADSTNGVVVEDNSTGDRGANAEGSEIRDNLSSVSDNSAELPKPFFETQISMMTLNSVADSCPSRQHADDSDEEDEQKYLPVIDRIPEVNTDPSSMPELSAMTINSTAVVAHSINEDIQRDEDMDGTYYGGSTAGEGQSNENGWDDDASSLGGLHDLSEKIVNFEMTGPTDVPTPQNDSIASPLPDEVRQEGGSSDPQLDSSMANVYADDNSVPSRDKDADDELEYGLVVNKCPDSPPPLLDQMSVAASSMAVVAHNVEEDLKQDEELDATEHGGYTGDDIGTSASENDSQPLENIDAVSGANKSEAIQTVENKELSPRDRQDASALPDGGAQGEGDRVVDVTPKMEPKKVSRLSANSLAVLAHSIDQDFSDDEDDVGSASFLPIVNTIPAPQPPTMTPNSTAAQAATIREDFKLDETTEGGLGDVDWEDECPELEDIEPGEGEDETESEVIIDSEAAVPRGGPSQKQVVVVDHTPEGETPRKPKGDASLAVLAPSEDGTCLSINDDDDEDNINPIGERLGLGQEFGPVVNMSDMLPLLPTKGTSTAPSVTFSLAVEARSVERDIQFDDEMDETFCGDTTIEGGGENAWEDDNTFDDLETAQSRTRLPELAGEKNQRGTQNDGEKVEVWLDHTPQLNNALPEQGDASLVVLAPSAASTYRTADDSENDDDTITREDHQTYGKVVSHTPRLAPIPFVSSNSMAVGASSADYRSEMERDEEMDGTYYGGSAEDSDNDGWGADEKALDAIGRGQLATEEENLVDHVPSTEDEEKQKPTVTDPSLAVLAPSDDDSRDEGDDDTYSGLEVGPVVDVLPEEPPRNTEMYSSVAARHDGELEGTLFGDSTVGVDTGWDDDDVIFEDDSEDQQETQEIKPRGLLKDPNEGQVTELIPDNASSHMEDSTDRKHYVNATPSQDGLVYVDHTPSEMGSAGPKNSVAWLTNVESGISGDEAGDTEEGWQDNDPQLVREAEEDQLVDRIPQRPESRFGDASTLVVADPSEVLSQAGDLLQEDVDFFQPIVDLTPPSRPTALNAPSAAGSTIVVAPTVPPDDLDDADPDDTVNAADENGWEDDLPELEQTPNPQSGNDEEAARVREQVVDFLPPQQEPAADQNRDGWSEVATGAAPSVLQADPKEDEFGPVVDQLPAPHPSTLFSAVSTASQVASSECDALAGEDETEDDSKLGRNSNVVVEPLPRPFDVGPQNLDSTASLAQSLASEDEDDAGSLSAGVYGQVVDICPSIRSSLPPSRGGSTVDALATVSEVIDDDDDGDDGSSSSDEGGNEGWGDDDLAEIDLSDRNQAEPVPSSNSAAVRPTDDQSSSQERGMTVRFRSVVAAIFESSTNSEASQTPGLDSNNGRKDSRAKGEENQVFHDEDEEPNAWGDDIDIDIDVPLNMDAAKASCNDRSMLSSPDRFAQFAEADTPPATPYTRTQPTQYDPSEIPPTGVVWPDLVVPSSTAQPEQCSACANATTIDCPCVQRILKNKDDGDDTIQIDYNKLLQTEISKRRLIEEESNDLRRSIDTLKNSKTAGEIRMEAVRTLQEQVRLVEGKLRDVGNDCDMLRSKNQELQSSLDETQNALSVWEERERQWSAKEAALREDVEKTGRELEQSLVVSERNQGLKDQLLAETEKKQESVDKLSHQVGTLQAECSDLRVENASMASDLQSLKKSLAERDVEIKELVAKEASYESEMRSLRETVEELETANISSTELREQYEALKAKLSAKELACTQLTNDVTSLQQRVQAAEGERYKLMMDQARMSKQHEEEFARNNNELDSTRKELDEARNMLLVESNNFTLRQTELDTEIKLLLEEKGALENEVDTIQCAGQNAMSELRSTLDQKEAELQVATGQLDAMKEQNTSLTAELEKLNALAQKAENLEEQMHSTLNERDALRTSLNESNDRVELLQRRINDQSIEKGSVETSKEKEIESLVAERASLRSTITANMGQIEDLERELSGLSDEKQILETEVEKLKSTCDRLSASVEATRTDAAKDATDQSRLAQELESITQSMTSLKGERDTAQKERDEACLKNNSLESSLIAASNETQLNAKKVSDLEGLLSKAQEELLSLRKGHAAAAKERDDYIDKCRDLEGMLAGASNDSQETMHLREQNNTLSKKINAVEQEFHDQSIVLQDFEARVTALGNELSGERQLNVEKEEMMTELRRELDLTRASLEQSSEGVDLLPRRIAELEATVSRLEAERNDLFATVQGPTSNEQEFHNISETLAQDRDTALAERDRLTEENEEMLVQFGLLNEQMESYQEQVRDLQELVQRYERTSEVAEARMLELQQRLVSAEDSKLENGEHHTSKSTAHETELEDLRTEQRRLIHEIEELSTANSQKDARIDALELELQGTRSQVEVLEKAQARAASIAAENEQFRSAIEALEVEKDELNANCKSQVAAMSRLKTDLDEMQKAKAAFERRACTLEEACLDRDQALKQKELEMRGLVERLHEASGDSSEATQEILQLRDRLNQMEHTARESTARVNELEASHEKSLEELESAKQKVSLLEGSVEQLEQELIAKEEAAQSQSGDRQNLISILEDKLQVKTKEVAELSSENAALSSEIGAVRSDLEAERKNEQTPAVDLTQSIEMESIKDQIKSLQDELEKTKLQSSEHEQALQEELSDLKQSFASKNGEVVMLRHKMQSLNNELVESRNEVQAKQDDLNHVKAELDDFKERKEAMEKAGATSASQLLQQTKENAEDVENLRSTIISLARALETSENRRADAIDRILKERETYADSLRRLSDSVKRFYTTMSFGEN